MTGIATKESPFTPGRPVPVEYFVARHKEIERIERAIGQTTFGRNENVFITGERGIGKSSLAGFVRCLAEKEYGLIGSHCPLGGVSTLEDMMGVIFQRLLQDCTDKSLFDKLKDFFSEYIKGLTLFGVGVEFTEDRSKLKTLVNNFLPVMRKVYSEIQNTGRKGLILILDDLNGITDVPVFSRFLKSFVDELATSGKPLPILLVLVGLPERREELIKHQPSVARIFDIIVLPLMSKSESEEFFTNMFGRQNVIVSSTALSMMVEMSAGFPMIMHEVGDAVFWQDRDNNINEVDAFGGITEAAKVVGKKYIEPQISKLLKSKKYASILRFIYKRVPLGGMFSRHQILASLPSSEQKSLDHLLQRSIELGIIQADEARGEYRFVNPSYHLYLYTRFVHE